MMWELIKETFHRKGYIRIVHISWLAFYGLLFLVPWPPEMGWQWGPFLFGWGACVMPILISAGIIGNDIASRRIALLVTKPLLSMKLYMYRLIGLSFQCAVHIAVGGLIMFVLHTMTHRGSIEGLGSWMMVGWLISNTWLALSTSLSVVVRREHNAIFIILGAIFVFIMANVLHAFFHDSIWIVILGKVVRYGLIPIELLLRIAMGECNLMRSIAYVLHAFGLTIVYSLIGIILLDKREFSSKRD